MIKGSKILLLSAVCLSLCSCSTGPVGRTLDCVDLWRFNNCIVFPKNKVTKKGEVCLIGAESVFIRSLIVLLNTRSLRKSGKVIKKCRCVVCFKYGVEVRWFFL